MLASAGGVYESAVAAHEWNEKAALLVGPAQGKTLKVLSFSPTYMNISSSPFLSINFWNLVLLESNLLIIDADKNV